MFFSSVLHFHCNSFYHLVLWHPKVETAMLLDVDRSAQGSPCHLRDFSKSL